MNSSKDILLTNNSIATKYTQLFNIGVVLFICCWFIWPFINFKLGVTPFLLLFILWFLTTNLKWILALPKDLLMILVWLMTFFPYIITGTFRFGAMNPKNVLISFFLFFVGIAINHYYMYFKKDISTLGKISFFSTLFFLIGSVQSSMGLKVYPLAARSLATGTDPLHVTYLSLGIGGFGFVYSAVFINLLLLFFILKSHPMNSKVIRYLSICVFVVISYMLFLASYATALLFVMVGILFAIFIKGKKSLFFCSLLACTLFLMIPKESIGYFIMDISQLFQTNSVISSKFLDLAQGFVVDSMGLQTSARSQLYLASLETFLKNPLFGIYGPFGNPTNAIVGGHSGWLDLLAYYGLFGSLPLYIAIYLNFKKHLRYYANHPYHHILLINQILFIFFGFVNPIIYIYQIGFVLFVVAPLFPYLPHAFSKNISVKGNVK